MKLTDILSFVAEVAVVVYSSQCPAESVATRDTDKWQVVASLAVAN